jgi:TonB family protein
MKLRLFCLALFLALGACMNVSAQTTDAPAVVAAVAPVYPAIAAAAKASGNVNVDVKIDANGNVSSARAVDAHALLKGVCEATARRWKFAPATGSKSERTARLIFTFREVADRVPEHERTPVFLPPYRVEVTGPKLIIKTETTH